MLGWIRGWWDDRDDRLRDERMRRSGTGSRWRWRLAEFVDRRRPNSCWASGGAEFGLGWSDKLTADNGTCIESAQKLGSCYCAKVVRADLADEYSAADVGFRLLVPPKEVSCQVDA
jgi:hypothetical protein